MIKGTDINSTAPLPTTEDELERQAIEDHFDAAINAATASGDWPAAPTRLRNMWKTSNIEAVISKYRNNGWTVTPMKTGRAMAHLMPTHLIQQEQKGS